MAETEMLKKGRIRVRSLKNQALIADQCIVANRFFTRLKGLIGTKVFNAGEGMLFPKCNDIHMWFMSIPIDVVFMRPVSRDPGAARVVTSVRPGVRPWRVLPLRDGDASETLELPAGSIERCGISAGDELCFD